jgi:hypothetical protein
VSGAVKTVGVYENGGRVAAAVTFGWPRAIAACRHAWETRSSVTDLLTALSGLADRHRVAV